MLKVKYLLRYYGSLKNIAVQRFSTDWIVSETYRAIAVLLRAFIEEGDRFRTIAALRYFANGIKARRERERFLAEHFLWLNQELILQLEIPVL
jgi:hypothetical protein